MLDILEKKLTENPTTRKGLTTAEAEKRLSTDGENRLAKKKKTSAAKIFAGQFHDVMVMILLVSVVISVALGQYADAVPIVLIVIINAALGFIQEYRCEKTLEKAGNSSQDQTVQEDNKTEQAYSEEKPTFTDWETVTGITMPPVDYKEGTVKYKSMNEEFSMGAYEYSVTEAVTTKDLNYAYEIMNKDSADLIVNDMIKAYPTGRVKLEKNNFLWVKIHVKYDGEKDFKTNMQTFLIKRDDGHLWEHGNTSIIQDEATLLYPKESYMTNDVILKAGEERDYWFLFTIYNYNPQINELYMCGTLGNGCNTWSINHYSGNLIELKIEDKTNR